MRVFVLSLSPSLGMVHSPAMAHVRKKSHTVTISCSYCGKRVRRKPHSGPRYCSHAHTMAAHRDRKAFHSILIVCLLLQVQRERAKQLQPLRSAAAKIAPRHYLFLTRKLALSIRRSLRSRDSRPPSRGDGSDPWSYVQGRDKGHLDPLRRPHSAGCGGARRVGGVHCPFAQECPQCQNPHRGHW